MSDYGFAMQDDNQQIITVKEMRKLLGKDHASLSDREVESVIVVGELVAEIVIKRIKRDLVPKST